MDDNYPTSDDGVAPVLEENENSGSDSESDTSSTTTGDTAIEVNPKLSLVRIGNIDGDSTDEDFSLDFDEDTKDRDKHKVSTPDQLSDLPDTFVKSDMSSPRFKSRRKFDTRRKLGQYGGAGMNRSGTVIKSSYNDVDEHTTAKNEYNISGGNISGFSPQRITDPVDRTVSDGHSSSGEDSETNSDSSGSFDCFDGDTGELIKSTEGHDQDFGSRGLKTIRRKLSALGEVEEEDTDESSGTSSDEDGTSVSVQEEPKFSNPELSGQVSANDPYQSVEDVIEHKPATVQNSGLLPVSYGDSDEVRKQNYENELFSNKPSNPRATAAGSENVIPSPTRKNELGNFATNSTKFTPSLGNFSTSDITLGDMQDMDSSLVYTYTPPPSDPFPSAPVYTDTGVQTLRSYRQPMTCIFNPERYFRPSDVETTTFSITTVYDSGIVEEKEFAERAVQVTFDPLWDKGRDSSPSTKKETSVSQESENFNKADVSGEINQELDDSTVASSLEKTVDKNQDWVIPQSRGNETIIPNHVFTNLSSSDYFGPEQENIRLTESIDEKGKEVPTCNSTDLTCPKSIADGKYVHDPQNIEDSKGLPVTNENHSACTSGRPKTPPVFMDREHVKSSISVDIDINDIESDSAKEGDITQHNFSPVALEKVVVSDDSSSDAEDENKSEGEQEKPKAPRMFDVLCRPNIGKVGSQRIRPKKQTEVPALDKKRVNSAVEENNAGKRTSELKITLSKPRPHSESDKDKREYRSVLKEPIETKPHNISHLIHLPAKTVQADREKITEARQEYLNTPHDENKSSADERKELLGKLLGTRDWSDRPKPILKKPSFSFDTHISKNEKDALSKELSKSRESNVGVFSNEDVRDKISAAVERQKKEDKAKLERTPMRATVGPIECSRYRQNQQKKDLETAPKSQTLPAGLGAPKENARSLDHVLDSQSRSLPRTFSVVLVRSPSMTLHRTASSFFSDRKSYTNLLETDIDSGAATEKPLIMETDLDEVIRLRKQHMPPKSRSLQDLSKAVGLKPIVTDVYDDTVKPDKKWEKTQSMVALTSLSVFDDNDTTSKESDLNVSQAEEPPKRILSEHEIRISKSLTKLNLPKWYTESPPKPREEVKTPRSPRTPKFSVGDSEPRSRKSSASSSVSQAAKPVVINTRVTIPRRSPVNSSPPTTVGKTDFELPSERYRKRGLQNTLKPIQSRLAPPGAPRAHNKDAGVNKSDEGLPKDDKNVSVLDSVGRLQSQREIMEHTEDESKSKSIVSQLKSEPDVKRGSNSPTESKVVPDDAIGAFEDFLNPQHAPIASSSPQENRKFVANASINLQTDKPEGVTKVHDTSSESELSFFNNRKPLNVNDKDRQFKPVTPSSDTSDASSSRSRSPKFENAASREPTTKPAMDIIPNTKSKMSNDGKFIRGRVVSPPRVPPPDPPKPKPASLSHPVNSSVESSESSSFRVSLARSPARPYGQNKESKAVESPLQPVDHRRSEQSKIASSSKSAFRPQGGSSIHSDNRVIETDIDGDLPLAQNSRQSSWTNNRHHQPLRKLDETDLDTVKRKVPSYHETDIDGGKQIPSRNNNIKETDIDGDLQQRTNNNINRGNSPPPALPPRPLKFHSEQPKYEIDYGPAPNLPPRRTGKKVPDIDYGPPPDLPPRRTMGKRIQVQLDDADGNVHSANSRYGSPKPAASEFQGSHQDTSTYYEPIGTSNRRQYYDNVPGVTASVSYGDAPGHRRTNPTHQGSDYRQPTENHRSSYSKEMPRSVGSSRVDEHQKFGAPPIPPRGSPQRDIPPPSIHRSDDFFESDLQFDPHDWQTVAVEGDANSVTPHGTLTRFGQAQRSKPIYQHEFRANPRSQAMHTNFDFEPPSYSIPPTPGTATGSIYSSCGSGGPRSVHSNQHHTVLDDASLETEESLLLSFVLRKQQECVDYGIFQDEPIEKGGYQEDEKPSTDRSFKDIELGPDSYPKAVCNNSALKIDTKLSKGGFGKEEKNSGDGIGGKPNDRQASLADVLDGLLALPPSPLSSSPDGQDIFASFKTVDGSGSDQNFGIATESGENLLTLSNPGVGDMDENSIMVKCRNPKCGKATVLREARRTYKTCPYCYTYYCGRHCRRIFWTQHKAECGYNRVTSICKRIVKRICEDPGVHQQISKLAVRGYNSIGRGCVMLVLQDLLEAEAVLKEGVQSPRYLPIYCSIEELDEYQLLGDYVDNVVDMCVDYNPSKNFVVNVAVVTEKDSALTSPQHNGRPTIKKCAKLPLSCSFVEPPPSPSFLAKDVLTLSVHHRTQANSEYQGKEARLAEFQYVQHKLQQRCVCLREQYPDVFNQFVTYVDKNFLFDPITIYPCDGLTGYTFKCVIKLDVVDDPNSNSDS